MTIIVVPSKHSLIVCVILASILYISMRNALHDVIRGSLKVDRRGRLVHDQDPASFQQSPREAEQLPLPMAEVASLDSDERIEVGERVIQQILICRLMSRDKMHLAERLVYLGVICISLATTLPCTHPNAGSPFKPVMSRASRNVPEHNDPS